MQPWRAVLSSEPTNPQLAVLGCGSVGRRHIRNLTHLGSPPYVAVDPSPESRALVEKEFGIATKDTLTERALEECDAVIISSPSSSHFSQAKSAAAAGRHVFVEKPLATSLDGLNDLIHVVEAKRLVGFVGSNWKFHPSFRRMKEVLEKKVIGKITSARCQFGSYLPNWRPWQDYRQAYSSRAALGGGILLDSHEFDYMMWFLGPIQDISCFSGRVSSLEIETEDTASVIMRFANGAVADMHLDYTQRVYQRNFEFFGEAGTLLWSVRDRAVSLFTANDNNWVEWKEPPDYDLNTMYVEEMRHFLDCIEGSAKPITDFKHGYAVLQAILAAKESSQTGRAVRLNGSGNS